LADNYTQYERFAFFENQKTTMLSSGGVGFSISKGETLQDCRSYRIFGVSRQAWYG
jgi:hypothetical protein